MRTSWSNRRLLVAKEGRAGLKADELAADLEPLFRRSSTRFRPDCGTGRFQMLVANRAYDDYTGTMAIGRITRGSVAPGDVVAVLNATGDARRARWFRFLM